MKILSFALLSVCLFATLPWVNGTDCQSKGYPWDCLDMDGGCTGNKYTCSRYCTTNSDCPSACCQNSYCMYGKYCGISDPVPVPVPTNSGEYKQSFFLLAIVLMTIVVLFY